LQSEAIKSWFISAAYSEAVIYADFGFQAGSELIRRLTEELRHSRGQAKESAQKLERYTVWLVLLTVVLVVLTLVLVGHAVISIIGAD